MRRGSISKSPPSSRKTRPTVIPGDTPIPKRSAPFDGPRERADGCFFVTPGMPRPRRPRRIPRRRDLRWRRAPLRRRAHRRRHELGAQPAASPRSPMMLFAFASCCPFLMAISAAKRDAACAICDAGRACTPTLFTTTIDRSGGDCPHHARANKGRGSVRSFVRSGRDRPPAAERPAFSGSFLFIDSRRLALNCSGRGRSAP